ncbi:MULTISPECIES: hypothetical protein [Methylococcus]|jgi:hypothetical protein|uniref:Uncharacterized protein n=2 Tax=Methylococcus capsulatus TaxID=414 RepID=Q605E2_METCA|nr:hypothetical protein [Methylococcus capsulatus]AAU91505.1 hypothetical protein MCA2342 [Methylococcus capsulatus str. Bath]QXP91573.1 hypothetical protein KW114_05355 [Methylococcus capsulatus]CAI8836899.1 protein of unknown function [Methylococcus capsulatus]
MAKKVVPITSKPRGPVLSLVSAAEERTAPSPSPSTNTIDDLGKSGLVAKAVYGSVYCLSFSVVLGALVLGKLIPGRRVIAKGLQDGAAAARQSLTWLETPRSSPAPGFGPSTLKA